MRIGGAKRFGLVLAIVGSEVALASNWDWGDEVQGRHWRSSTLAWAQNSHPDHPSLSWIQYNFSPPADEMWCHGSPAPTSADCSEYHARLTTWLQDYLDVTNVPSGAFNAFPKECASICTP